MKTCILLISLLVTLGPGCPAWAEGEIVSAPDRRHEIDMRIGALDAERAEISTKGPKTATILGLGLIVVAGITLGAGVAAFGESQNDELEQELFATLWAGTALAGIGSITALTGGIIWGKRVGQRNEIDAERESLIKERDGLAAAISRIELRSPYRNGTQFVTLGMRF